jgi:hypothetical protein
MNNILKLYTNNTKIMHALDLACKQEQELADGLQLSEDVILRGLLDERDGLWQISFKVEHGEIAFLALDHELTKIRIVSLPSIEMIKDREAMDADQLIAKQYANARVLDVDMCDVASLKAAKAYFADDYVMSNIPLADPKAGNVARMLIYYLRSYRKIYTDYYKAFAFLWKDTPYTSALALRRAISLN